MAGAKTDVILASGARTSTGQTNTYYTERGDSVAFYLSVTAASGTSPTLDVTAQESPDGGTTWITRDSFTQATATTSETKAITPPNSGWWRLNYAIGGTNPSFTFAIWGVHASPAG